ncbi:HEAT repeat domain-containing protein [Nitrospira sp. Kam-Ns4a]
MGDPVLENIAALKDEDWGIREEAALALGASRDRRAVVPLLAMLKDPDRAVREAAITALTEIGEPAVTAVGACLDDPDLTVQESAACILARIGDARVSDRLMIALGSADWIVRMHTAQALGRIGEPRAVPRLLPLLNDKVKAVRVEAAQALVRIGPPAVAPLLAALTHGEWLVRLHAVEALGKLKSPEAVEPLLRVLFNDRDPAVREDSVRSLGEIGDVRAVEFLLLVMRDPGLRAPAVEALGKIGDRRAVPALLAVVAGASRPPDSRPIDGCGDRWDQEMLAMEAAVKALAQIGDEAAIPTLVAALKNTYVRAEAATALTAFGARAVPALVEVLRTEQDQNILYHVKEALARLGWRPHRI